MNSHLLWSRLKVSGLIGILTIILILGSGEILLRFILPPPHLQVALENIKSSSEETKEEDWEGWRLLPNQEFVSKDNLEIRINSWGCRDVEFTTSSATDKRRLLILGDSFVYGDGISQTETLPYQLRHLCKKNWDIISCGQWGYNTLDSYMLFKTQLLKTTPKEILLIYVLNDSECRIHCKQIAYRPIRRSDPTGKILNKLGKISRFFEFLAYNWSAQQSSKTFGQDIMNAFHEDQFGWKQSQKYLTKFASLAKSLNITFTIAIYPLMTGFQPYPFSDLHVKIKQFCKREGIKCLDILEAFKKDKHSSAYYHANLLDSHPNGRANHEASTYLATQLNCEN